MSFLTLPEKLRSALGSKAKNIILRAGRDSGKTHNSTAICSLIQAQSPELDGVACRASYGSISDSLYSEMEKAIDSIPAFNGLFQFRRSPLRIIRSNGGGTVYFKGIGGSNFSRTKGLSPKNKIGFALFDELQELKTERSLEEAIASFRRWYSDSAKIFYLFNPPPMEAHWINLWCARKERDPDFLVVDLSWEDISPFLSDYDIKEILKKKRDDPDYYDWFYMGKCSGGFGSVYPMIRKERHVITPLQFEKILSSGLSIAAVVIGADGAVNRDCTALVPGLILDNGQCVCGLPFIHDPTKDGVMGYHTLVKDHIKRWFWSMVKDYRLGRLENEPSSPYFREVPIWMTVDQAAPDLVQELRFFLSSRAEINPTSKGTVIEMVSTVQSAISNDMLYIVDYGGHYDYVKNAFDRTGCDLFNQLSLLTWNEKQTNYDPITPNDVADSATYLARLWYCNPENINAFELLTHTAVGKKRIADILGGKA